MKLKRFAAIAASVFIFTGGSVVNAAGNPATTVVKGTYRPTVIQVTVPATGAVYINPFELPVWMDSEYIWEQIVSSPAAIVNKSEIPMSVDVTVSGSVREGSDMVLSGTSTKDTESTQKKAFIYFEMKAANTNDPDYIGWDKEFDPGKHIVVRTEETTRKEMVTLDKWDVEGWNNCYGTFRLTGDCVVYPESAWNGNDGLSVKVSFSFTPVIPDIK